MDILSDSKKCKCLIYKSFPVLFDICKPDFNKYYVLFYDCKNSYYIQNFKEPCRFKILKP